jgi:hypothetical protein
VAQQSTEPRPEIGSDVEVFNEPKPTIAWPAFHHFSFDRPVSAVSQQQVDDRGEDEINEHVHGGLLEHGTPSSAHV